MFSFCENDMIITFVQVSVGAEVVLGKISMLKKPKILTIFGDKV